MTAARQAIADIAALETQVEAARVRRDKAIVDLHVKDGWRAPDIARGLSMSLSNVRLIIKANAPRSVG